MGQQRVSNIALINIEREYANSVVNNDIDRTKDIFLCRSMLVHRMTLVSFRLLRKNLGNWREFLDKLFGATPAGKKLPACLCKCSFFRKINMTCTQPRQMQSNRNDTMKFTYVQQITGGSVHSIVPWLISPL